MTLDRGEEGEGLVWEYLLYFEHSALIEFAKSQRYCLVLYRTNRDDAFAAAGIVYIIWRNDFNAAGLFTTVRPSYL